MGWIDRNRIILYTIRIIQVQGVFLKERASLNRKSDVDRLTGPESKVFHGRPGGRWGSLIETLTRNSRRKKRSISYPGEILLISSLRYCMRVLYERALFLLYNKLMIKYVSFVWREMHPRLKSTFTFDIFISFFIAVLTWWNTRRNNLRNESYGFF